VGSSLELLAAGTTEPTQAWSVLTSIFDALDEYLQRVHEDEFFGPWLLALYPELTALSDNGMAAGGAIRQRIEQAITDAIPMIELAYRASTDTSDWDWDM
jgi:hypothetical protein